MLDQIRWGEEKNEGKKNKGKEKGARGSTFSLGFTEIGSLVFIGCKRQSSSMRRELCMGTRIRGFRQTVRGRGSFPTLVIFDLRAI